jgi:hypothetical protein
VRTAAKGTTDARTRRPSVDDLLDLARLDRVEPAGDADRRRDEGASAQEGDIGLCSGDGAEQDGPEMYASWSAGRIHACRRSAVDGSRRTLRWAGNPFRSPAGRPLSRAAWQGPSGSHRCRTWSRRCAHKSGEGSAAGQAQRQRAAASCAIRGSERRCTNAPSSMPKAWIGSIRDSIQMRTRYWSKVPDLVSASSRTSTSQRAAAPGRRRTCLDGGSGRWPLSKVAA